MWSNPEQYSLFGGCKQPITTPPSQPKKTHGMVSADTVVAPNEATEDDLLVVHTPAYLESLKSSATVARITEVPPAAALPNSILQQKFLRPMRLQTGGTVLAGKLAVTRGWAINIGGGPGSRITLRHIWSVDRETDDERFRLHEDIKNRKLLWHGTNVAVVAAILKTGLRIMPHSGGRVGRGIYFASEHGKSAGYTRPAKGTGLMFLNEVALGKEHEIVQDNGSFVAAPSGFDSVVARGQVEPDPNADTKLTFAGKDVIVPQGTPQRQQKYSNSSFSQSEYLVYKESQVRIRYMLDFDFGRGW